MKKIIDVSTFQGQIDFNKLKGNVDGVMIRAGYGKNNIDNQFVRNVTECNRLGIPCGAYWFSYAYNTTMAQNEAKYLVAAVSKYRMELPLAFDYENDSVRYGTNKGVSITSNLVKNMTNAFCQEIEKSGYWCMLYSNPDYINKYFGTLAGGRYDLWLAYWPKNVDVSKPPRTCGMWQWGGSSVPGIKGNVDTNEAYKDYPTMLKQMGFNHLKDVEPTPAPEPEPTPAPEPDTQPWYTEAMTWAKENGICDGTRPEDAATRAEVSQMLYNYNKKFDS